MAQSTLSMNQRTFHFQANHAQSYQYCMSTLKMELSRQGETRQQNSSSETTICVPSTVLGEAFHGQEVVRPRREDWYGGADEKLSGKVALSMDRHEQGMIFSLLYENFLTLNRQ